MALFPTSLGYDIFTGYTKYKNSSRGFAKRCVPLQPFPATGRKYGYVEFP